MNTVFESIKIFFDAIKPYENAITAVATAFLAVYTIILAKIASRQNRDLRVTQRAYLDARFGGIDNNTEGELVGHVTFKNVGHLPATNFCWFVRLNAADNDWRPSTVKNEELVGESVIPVGAEWPIGSNGIPHLTNLKSDLPPDPNKWFLYVWGRVTYNDGFKRWWRRKRQLEFCHRYPWAKRTQDREGVQVATEYARYHEHGNAAS